MLTKKEKIIYDRILAKSDSIIEYPKWISVKDEMPEFNEDILVYYKCGDYGVSFRTEDWFCANDDKDFNDVTHWMKLPEPPIECLSRDELIEKAFNDSMEVDDDNIS